jgi:hypothetical protein
MSPARSSRRPGPLAHISPPLRPLAVAIETLRPDPANVNRHSERSIAGIAAALKRFGQQLPIVVTAAGVVKGGNGVLEAAKGLGWRRIAVVHTELAGLELEALAVALNRTARLSDPDQEALAELLGRLADSSGGSELTMAAGYDADELAELIGQKSQADGPEGVPEVWQVIVPCKSEAAQKKLCKLLEANGWEYTCQVL